MEVEANEVPQGELTRRLVASAKLSMARSGWMKALILKCKWQGIAVGIADAIASAEDDLSPCSELSPQVVAGVVVQIALLCLEVCEHSGLAKKDDAQLRADVLAETFVQLQSVFKLPPEVVARALSEAAAPRLQ